MKTTPSFHPKNKHQEGYDLEALCTAFPGLLPFVFENKHQTQTIDFANPKAVKALNTALLVKYYGVTFWAFPDTNLCPPIPGRVDYMHHIAHLVKKTNTENGVKILDIGTGASCIYPILGHAEYNWDFVATDIDERSLKTADKIVTKNNLSKSVTLRHQKDEAHIFTGIIEEDEMFSVAVCNPPFYKSEAEALEATTRKSKNLNKNTDKLVRNFSGTQNELLYKGGEKAFLHTYLYESSLYKTQCHWFTTLVSKKDLVKGMYASLKKLGATEIKTINMGQGNKISRIVAWTFMEK
ncbi:23S rRNA (adenine(1618)-N(6))-methyltransferase RlmF [Algibacter miyuki]|uniref:23S rRNA (adenine(1618)-N(6))-methyltransferase RlmF n=1 Tax=Algibacter miyuki TaxID=1306933 RepID=UPI0025B4A422|nr:23S rRNA (adenine(1618)-N(6))-methyltransferase RlmF [Algibacter miyuki]MDN3666894.1 23S rRNA (adenine(1618)-N(6))-methyltransferase RlmF [Algibacter miyuki]